VASWCRQRRIRCCSISRTIFRRKVQKTRGTYKVRQIARPIRRAKWKKLWSFTVDSAEQMASSLDE
jgi:hypothetical protein